MHSNHIVLANGDNFYIDSGTNTDSVFRSE